MAAVSAHDQDGWQGVAERIATSIGRARPPAGQRRRQLLTERTRVAIPTEAACADARRRATRAGRQRAQVARHAARALRGVGRWPHSRKRSCGAVTPPGCGARRCARRAAGAHAPRPHTGCGAAARSGRAPPAGRSRHRRCTPVVTASPSSPLAAHAFSCLLARCSLPARPVRRLASQRARRVPHWLRSAAHRRAHSPGAAAATFQRRACC